MIWAGGGLGEALADVTGGCNAAPMPNFDTHVDGMPVWIDAMVATRQQHDRLRAFYSGLFGWKWDVGGEEMGFYSRATVDGRPVFGLGAIDGAQGHVVTYFSTSDLATSVATAVGLGGELVVEPNQVMDLGAMALLRDPVGAMHGLWQPGTFAGFGVLYELGAPGWFDHVSSDPARAADYYRQLLDKTLDETQPGMRILKNADQWFASVSHDQVPRRAAQWNPIYVGGPLAQVRATATSLGATIVLEEMEVPGSAITVVVEPVTSSSITIMRAGEPPEA
jgi:uncharacterized protein